MMKAIFSIMLFLLSHYFLQAQCDLTVPIIPSPEVPGNVYCSYDDVELKTTAFDNYQWEYRFSGSSNNWTAMGNGSNQSLLINAGEWGGTLFRVRVTQDTCTAYSDSILIDSWVFIPPFIIQESGQLEFCTGDSTKLAAGGPTFDSIQWLHDFEPIPGANDPVYWVRESGNYVLQGTPELCPESWLSSGVGPTYIFSGPDTPEISDSNDTLFASSGPHYQWLLDGQPINGANQGFWIPLMSGDYTVEVRDANNCTATSAVFPVIINEVEDPSLANNIRLAPNPVLDILTIQSSFAEAMQISILDVYGRTVIASQWVEQQIHIDFSQLPSGMYFAKVENEGRFVILKVMKK
ncbi:MAG: hypothetical protein DHS20C18_32540 [Saprospiraceae bacterium]|nr:MAG: hypothetical protein DHS20C18_32540 [Saprospiraceae bacterium]